MGGASEGFHMEGFDCLGIEINSEIAKLYPYKVIVADMRDLRGKDFRGYDVIWGSPPCVDFSTANCPNKTRNNPRNNNPRTKREIQT
jgi:site-specific DNA-cytosine methylase